MSFSRLSKELIIDVVKLLNCTIESCYNVKDHTVYILRLKCSVVPDSGHEVTKRYSDFATLDATLRSYGVDLPLPPKKVFGKMDSEFIERRQEGLQKYLMAILAHPWVSLCFDTRAFFHPETYLTLDYNETAIQNVSMLLRSESRWQVDEVLPNIGWRLGKSYMSITDRNRPKDKFLLTWCTSGPDRTLDDHELEQAVKLLSSLQHPGVEPMLFATCNRSATVVIRAFCNEGTLRDSLCSTKPSLHFMKKYADPKSHRILQLSDIRLFGRQILETLKFLHEKGFPNVDLHSGNVICRGQQCVLLDLENSILGLSSINRRWYTQLRKLQSLEAVEVYCFGRLLYEMTTGRPLPGTSCDIIPHGCSPGLKAVLEMTISASACKSGLPSLESLLQHPFFAEVLLPPSEPVQLRMASKLVQGFERARISFIQRVNEEQRTICQYRRMVKAQAFHMSEEEKKRRKLQKMKSLNESSCPTTVVEASSESSPTIPSNNASVINNGTLPTLPECSPVSPKQTGVAAEADHPEPSSDDVSIAVRTNTTLPGRANLLQSVTNFNKANLRKSQSVDSGR